MINNDLGWLNTAVGSSAMNGNNSGSRNTAVGEMALYTNSSGSYNTAIGKSALFNTIESYNTAIGAEALKTNSSGALNTASGYKTLHLNQGGSENTAMGANALQKNVVSYNSAFGVNALLNTTEGAQNTAVGTNALLLNDAGSKNTAIGADADVLDSNFENATAIGYNTKVGQSNAVVIGNTDVNVGIAGVSNPTEKLEVPGAIKIGNTDNASPTAGTVRWNPDSGSFEGFNGNMWLSLDRTNEGWGGSDTHLEDTQITPSDGASNDLYGYSVSCKESFSIVGAYNDSVDAAGQGSAYTYYNNTWLQTTKLVASDGAEDDFFGYSVDISLYYAIVGAPGYNNDQGCVYIFKRSINTWYQYAKLTATDGAEGDMFGYSVTISSDDNYAIVGAKYDNVGTALKQGSAYIFARSGAVWSQQAKLTASDGEALSYFGNSVDMDRNGDRVVIGAIGARISYPIVGYYETGVAYVFERSGTSWSQEEKLLASNGADNACFGSSVSIDGDYIIVGADKSKANYIQDWTAGEAYIFLRNGSSWSEQAILSPMVNYGGGFGKSVSIYDNYVVVGAPNETGYGGVAMGLSYLFKRTGITWSQNANFEASNAYDYDRFGNSVSINSDRVLVGAHYNNVGNNFNQGSVYIFNK